MKLVKHNVGLWIQGELERSGKISLQGEWIQGELERSGKISFTWTRRTHSRSGPRTSLGPVTLTVGVVLGPVWGPLH